MKNLYPFSLLAVFCLLLNAASAQNNTDNFWSVEHEGNIKLSGKKQIIPQKYLTFQVNTEAFKNKLFTAPHEKNVRVTASNCIISLPLPNGSIQQFRVIESPMMAAELSNAYPNMKTFTVRGIDDVYANGKLDWNEFGFHGMIRSVNGDFFIDPYCVNDLKNYITYYTSDFIKAPSDISPEIGLVEGTGKKPEAPASGSQGSNLKTTNSTPAICIGDQLRTYRLAVTCTGEYAVAATGLPSPSVGQTLSKIITSVNRVNGVYETELAVRMVLVPTETNVIFTNPSTDPYTANNNGSALLAESQTNIAGIIGLANFDIGHIFSTGGGGIAFLGCVCSGNDKARGVTGSQNPVGDPYDIDYVAHEMGHQFEGNHTFNAITGSCNGNRNASTSTEPGSGVTIMAYAGICNFANDLAGNSIPYFHAASYDEIVNFTNTGGGSACPIISTTGNLPPVVVGSGDYTIPKNTAFSLTGSATDPENDPVTFSWEEMDPGLAAGNWNSGSRPYFRSYSVTASPTRNFPITSVVLSGNYTGTKGEYVPQTAQALKFRLTGRDGLGGVCYDVNTITIDNSGPLKVTNPNAFGIVWNSGSQQTVTWDVNNTNLSPVSCSLVRILISTNGGTTFSVLVNSTQNDGTEVVTSPTVASNINTCRIKVEAFGNVFYDIDDFNFTISTSTVSGNVGISAVSQNNPLGLSVWPNPVNNQFSFSAGHLNSESMTRLTILDVLGKMVIQNEYANKTEIKENIDVSSLSKGLYFVKVTNDGNQAVYRILKE